MMQKEPELFCHLSGCNQWAETFKLLDGELQMLGLAINGNAITHMQQVSHRELKMNKFLNFRLNFETSLEQCVWEITIIFWFTRNEPAWRSALKTCDSCCKIVWGWIMCHIAAHTHSLFLCLSIFYICLPLCVCVFAVFLNLALNYTHFMTCNGCSNLPSTEIRKTVFRSWISV